MLNILSGCFYAIWRRWFGGGLDFLGSNRFIQHIIGFSVTCFILWVCGYHWLQIIACAGVLQGLYWAKQHGCCFDYGNGSVDEERYNKMWSWRILKKYIPKKQWYGFGADYLLMNARYTIPSILIALILWSVPALFMGFALSGMYALCWIAHDFNWTDDPTEWGEILGGFITGVLLVL